MNGQNEKEDSQKAEEICLEPATWKMVYLKQSPKYEGTNSEEELKEKGISEDNLEVGSNANMISEINNESLPGPQNKTPLRLSTLEMEKRTSNLPTTTFDETTPGTTMRLPRTRLAVVSRSTKSTMQSTEVSSEVAPSSGTMTTVKSDQILPPFPEQTKTLPRSLDLLPMKDNFPEQKDTTFFTAYNASLMTSLLLTPIVSPFLFFFTHDSVARTAIFLGWGVSCLTWGAFALIFSEFFLPSSVERIGFLLLFYSGMSLMISGVLLIIFSIYLYQKQKTTPATTPTHPREFKSEQNR